MKKDIQPHASSVHTPNNTTDASAEKQGMNRRKFVELTAAAAVGFTIMPRHVLGGKGYVAPSDKITLAYIGVGTQGIRELLPLLEHPQIQVVAIADPNKEPIGYRDWGVTYLRDAIRKTINKADWTAGENVIPGGRDVGKSIVDSYYANLHPEQ